MFSEIKSPLPTPKFYPEQTFSAKKDKRNRRSLKTPPPTPRSKGSDYSCSSLSRLFSQNSYGSVRAQSISFQNPYSPLSTIYDRTNAKLYFHQCFELICKLGSGSFGEVFKVRCKEDRRYYAVKKAKQKFTGKADRERKLQEVQKHEQLPRHPNCVKFYKAWEEEQYLYIQTELCSFSLSQYADINHHIPEKIIWSYLIDLLLALKHLHDHNLVHLDVKPDNIFITENGVCKLGDFGLVLDLSKSDVSDASEGDPRYIAPELMQGVFTKAADIFSLGITILELASDLDLPAGEEKWHQLRNLQIPEQFLQKLSLELIGVITIMMEPDHKKRLSAEDILQLPIITGVLKKRKKQIRLSESDQINRTPSRRKSLAPGWGYKISDGVFDRNSNGSVNSPSHPEKSLSFSDDVFFNASQNSFDSSRPCLAIPTPPEFLYWGSKDLHSSPHLSGFKKKGSDDEISPSFRKSPRLQLFNDSTEEDDLNSNFLPKSLLNVFNSLSPTL